MWKDADIHPKCTQIFTSCPDTRSPLEIKAFKKTNMPPNISISNVSHWLNPPNLPTFINSFDSHMIFLWQWKRRKKKTRKWIWVPASWTFHASSLRRSDNQTWHKENEHVSGRSRSGSECNIQQVVGNVKYQYLSTQLLFHSFTDSEPNSDWSKNDWLQL